MANKLTPEINRHINELNRTLPKLPLINKQGQAVFNKEIKKLLYHELPTKEQDKYFAEFGMEAQNKSYTFAEQVPQYFNHGVELRRLYSIYGTKGIQQHC